MPIKLSIKLDPGNTPSEYELSFKKATISLGRDKNCDVRIPLVGASRRHAMLFMENQHWYLEDLDSKHGTKLNSVLLEPRCRRKIQSGDVITIVNAILEISIQELDFDKYPRQETAIIARKMVEQLFSNQPENQSNRYFLFMNGSHVGQTISIDDSSNELIVGRGDDAGFVIDDTNISRHHAKIVHDSLTVSIEDLGSTNGVLVNQIPIEAITSIKDGDEIKLGPVELRYFDHSKPLELPSTIQLHGESAVDPKVSETVPVESRIVDNVAVTQQSQVPVNSQAEATKKKSDSADVLRSAIHSNKYGLVLYTLEATVFIGVMTGLIIFFTI